MKTFDQYSLNFLELSKRFLEKAKEETTDDGKMAYRTASLYISFCSLEAFVNGTISDFSEWNKFSVHERALLLEKHVKFENGEYVLTDQLQMTKLKDKIELLLHKFKCQENYKKSRWWGLLGQSIDLRNSMTHPKEIKQLSDKQIEELIDIGYSSTKEVLQEKKEPLLV